MIIEWKTLRRICISLFLLYLCIYYWSSVSAFLSSALVAITPLLFGGLFAYIINILLSFYERVLFKHVKRPLLRRIERTFCITLSLATLIAILSLIICLVVPELISAITLLISELPDAIYSLIKWLDESEYLSNDIISLLNSIDWQSKINQVFDLMTSGIGNVMDIVINTVTSVFSVVINTFVSVIFAIYLVFNKDKLSAQIHRLIRNYLPIQTHNKLYYTVGVLNDSFHRYIVGQSTEAVILGVLCTIGMLILRLPYPTMIGALIAFTALIPVAGAYIGSIIGAFMIFTVSPLKSLIFIIFIIILQQLEGNLIYPRVVGSSVGLPPIWVLVAVTFGGGILGILGMLIGVPLAATIYKLIRDDIIDREDAEQKIK